MLAKKLMGATAAKEKLYVDDVFSTFLYTGNGSTQTINNGIDLAGEGGLVWIKQRSAAGWHNLVDTARGRAYNLYTNSTEGHRGASASNSNITAFNADGFTLGAPDSYANTNDSGVTHVSWTFRRAPKFFDVVTYTGNGVAGRQIPHELGIAPGMVVVKRTDSTGNWPALHRSLPASNGVFLNLTTSAIAGVNDLWNSTHATDSNFIVGPSSDTNLNGATYVAYLFAHDDSEDGIIQCGSGYAPGGAGQFEDIGFEPQWILVKPYDQGGANLFGWYVWDSMRGSSLLQPHTAGSEFAYSGGLADGIISVTPTGFKLSTGFFGSTNTNYIYLAIRRPNKPPKSGAEVYVSSAASGVINTGFPVDLHIGATRAGSSTNHSLHDRLRGGTKELASSSTAAESTVADLLFDRNSGLRFSFPLGQINHFFRRCPSFHDQICYTGAGSNKTEAHNLGKQPELWFAKRSNAAGSWVWGSTLLNANEKIVMPSPNGRVTDATAWNSAYPTDSNISLGTLADVNASSGTYTLYMWATCLGVSKVGKYTGNGSSQQIDCGFSTGARFAMVIRLTAGVAQDIYLWDSARGITSGNDPRLSLNTTAAEVTGLDTIDPHASGFIVNQDASNVNVSGAEYLFLAIS